MEHCQKGDWSSTRHMAVRFEDVGALTRLAYTWVQMFDIEKRIPMSVTLTEPGLDGVFRIPVESDMSPGTHYLVLRAVYMHSGESYGLITAKHFSDMYTDNRGHQVKHISYVARGPLAWVKMNTTADRNELYTGDTVSGYQPEAIVSNIYTRVTRCVHSGLVSPSYEPDEREALATKLVSKTLAILGAPLAFKVLHEQSRLTLERSRCSEDREICTIPDPRDALWGTRVLWKLDSDLSLSRATVNQETDTSPVSGTVQWLGVRLLYMGLELTGSSPGRCTKEIIKAPYWAVILTALCCGALDHWSRELDELSALLRIDAHLHSTSDPKRDELCQRCGYAYRVSPVVCEPEPKRVSAVLQIDKLLLGSICTTLCATVSRDIGNGAESDPKGDRAQPHKYCLNHRRDYSASLEETAELNKGTPSGRGQGGGGEGEGGEEEDEDTEHNVQERNSARTNRIASWWEHGSPCYWGEDHGEEDKRQRCTRDQALSRMRAKERSIKQQKISGTQADHEPGLWSWQKECRFRLGYTTHNPTVCKHRFWELFHSGSGLRGDERSRASTSIGYWKQFSCHTRTYHIKTFPFGYQGGLLGM